MTKSDELCRLLGIEAKIYTYKKCTNIDMCGVLEEEPPKMKYVCEKCNIKNYILKDKYTYPDLTRPSNFVKLLELTKYLCEIEFSNDYCQLSTNGMSYGADIESDRSKSVSIGLVNSLIKFITNHCIQEFEEDIDEDYTMFLEQAQQTEWEY